MTTDSICGADLYLGDCNAILPEIYMVDSVITDPPYSIKTHEGARTGGGDDILIDFQSISSKDLVSLSSSLVSKSKNWVVMTCDWLHCAALANEMPDEFIRAGVWVKPNGMPQYTGDRPSMGWESVAILHRAGRKKWNGGGRHAVWNIPKVSGNHPTEKPIALVESFVSLFTNPGDLVLDPFMGSGTTGVACANLGRRFIGIERDEKYYRIAKQRIEAAYAQGRLFA